MLKLNSARLVKEKCRKKGANQIHDLGGKVDPFASNSQRVDKIGNAMVNCRDVRYTDRNSRGLSKHS